MSITFENPRWYLGKLCQLNHEWENTEQSLRTRYNWGCIECNKIASKKSKEKNADKVKAYQAQYRLSENYTVAQQKYWSKPESLEKRKQYNAEYRSTENGKQKRNEGQKRYAQTDKGKITHEKAVAKYLQTEKGKLKTRECVKRRRAVSLSVHSSYFTELQMAKRLAEFDNCCVYCGKKATVLDHFIPITKGGSHVLNNLVAACKSCNTSKFNHNADTWYKSKPFFSKERWNKLLKVLGKTEATLNQLPLF